jgi:hypothetical protein
MVRNRHGDSLACVAARAGRRDVLRLLSDRGAPPDCPALPRRRAGGALFDAFRRRVGR